MPLVSGLRRPSILCLACSPSSRPIPWTGRRVIRGSCSPLTPAVSRSYKPTMDLHLSPAHLAFQGDLRSWLAANVARPWRDELRDPAATEDSLIEVRRA